MPFLPQERAKAKAEGKTTYYTGRPCKHGHVAKRTTSNGICVICNSIRQERWRKDNPTKAKQRDALYYLRYSKRDQAIQYRLSNPDKVKAATKKWQIANKHKKAQAERKRYAAKLGATPDWLSKSDMEWMNDIYLEAKKLSDAKGVDVNVDHIVPLQGKDVCGLHVPWNLRLVSRSYNSKKSNNTEDVPFIPDRGNIVVHSSILPWNL